MRCDKCGVDIPPGGGSFDHYFCGYGYAAMYCAACCPQVSDGIVCLLDHPSDIPGVSAFLRDCQDRLMSLPGR